MNLTRGINLRKIAELMPGASGAEVKVSDGVLYSTVIISFVRIFFFFNHPQRCTSVKIAHKTSNVSSWDVSILKSGNVEVISSQW